MFYALTQRESYFKGKINLFVALAPITYLQNVGSDSLKIASYLSALLYANLKFYDVYELFG